MYQFHTTPPPDPKGPSLPLLRCRAGKPTIAIVTCEKMLGLYTHYWGGRTLPCSGEKCDACAEGMQYRWHGYIVAYSLAVKRQFLFESTARAAETFTTYHRANNTLRACHFTASRMNYRANSRVVIETKTHNLEGIRLPNPPDILRCLCRIWDIPLADCQIDAPDRMAPSIRVDDVDGTKQLSRPRIHNPATEGNGEPVPS